MLPKIRRWSRCSDKGTMKRVNMSIGRQVCLLRLEHDAGELQGALNIEAVD